MTIHCQARSGPFAEAGTLPGRVGILIPAYNEAANLRRVVSACRRIRPAVVLVVDDASSDKTPEVLADETRSLQRGVLVSWLRNVHNLGKQGSVRRGLRELARHDLDAVALLDGDGQHDPSELPRLAALLAEFDFVIGARSRRCMPLQRQLSNWLVNLGFRLIGGVDFVDVQSGLRIYRKRLADVLAERLPEAGGYALEHESLALLAGWARERGIELRAAAAPIQCTYGEGTSSMQPVHVLQLAVETIRQAARLRQVMDVPAVSG